MNTHIFDYPETNEIDDDDLFQIWIESKMPYLRGLFDFEQRVYLPEKVEYFLGVASRGQTIMARFALSVWTHNDDFEFNFLDAAAILDPDNLDIIIGWLEKPIWP